MKKLFLIFCLFIISKIVSAQNNNVGIGSNNPDASSKLEVSSNTQGLLIPRMTSSERLAIVSPAVGLLLYDTDKRTIYFFDGQNWLPFAYALNNSELPPTSRSTGAATSTLGYRVAVDELGILSSTDNGRVFYFESGGGNFTKIEEIISNVGNPITEKFGSDVAISGNFAAIGAPGAVGDSGKVYIFERIGGSWVQRQILKTTAFGAINNGFGRSVAMSGNMLVVGAPFDDPFSSTDEGSFHIFTKSGSVFSAVRNVIQPGGSGFAAGDYFGWDVAVHGSHILVGAPGHSSKEGKVYFYRFAAGSLTLDFQKDYSTVADPNCFYGYSVAIDSSGAIIGYPGNSNNAGGFHIIGNFNGPNFGDEAFEFEQFFIDKSGSSTLDRNRYCGASVAISGKYFIIGTPDKIDPLFSTSYNLNRPSKVEIYRYSITSFFLDFNLLQTWESSSNILNGMGVSSALKIDRAVVGHDLANKFLVKDVGIE